MEHLEKISYYNGDGVATGDFNNDGKADIFFASNEGDNQLYLNKGALKFTEVSKEAQIPQDSAWNTGLSVVDVNNDGLLDIYICRLGNFEKFVSKNQLLICVGIENGIPKYKEAAAEYGLDFSGFSTQASFFDYDQDGDLDVFLLNHSVHQNGTFAPRTSFMGTFDPLSGDRIFANINGHFEDVTKASKINSTAISYGLGVVMSDINLDGWVDIYAGNDFHENDYLYINQKNGSFKDEQKERLMHTSQYSMGVDAADLNNDGFPEIVSMDMLPKDPYILKRSLGEDDYDIYQYKISVGYDYQFTRNNLQWNRRNGKFREVGMYAGMFATDWSWATLLMDFDNDGYKDIFVANGIPKRMNDMDYVNYVSNQEIQEKITALAVQLNKDYAGKRPLFLSILNGSFLFTADLFKQITIEAEVSFIKLASYKGTSSTGNVITAIGLDINVKDRHIVILEDIIDTGKTLHHYLPQLDSMQPASVKIAVLLNKKEALQFPVQVHYTCFDIPNKFVVGYGLDYDGLGRNSKDIYQLKA